MRGRYHYWWLHLFKLDKITQGMSPKDAFSRLMVVGEFPVQVLRYYFPNLIGPEVLGEAADIIPPINH